MGPLPLKLPGCATYKTYLTELFYVTIILLKVYHFILKKIETFTTY